MSWQVRFLKVAEFALRREDLRQRFIHATSADDLPWTPGIARAYENSVVLAIYESASAIYSDMADQMAYEIAYPGARSGNPKRADLAFKEAGRGKNWAYIEVKYYSTGGVRSDIQKLLAIKRKSQRWMFIYKVRDMTPRRRTLPLRKLVERSFADELAIVGGRYFPSYWAQGVEGRCEMLLARVRV
ncbi:hypothetical protein JYT28_01320 [Desulfobulbus sp. AH-315-M07]|nr:hypothetical protein [Desulfobulbus sp. AH-315-M07]